MVVVLIGTLDTKGDEIRFVQNLMNDQDIETHVIDAGVIGEPAFQGDTSREEIAAHSGKELSYLIEECSRNEAIEIMANGVQNAIREIHKNREISGVLAIGGSSGTRIGTAAMRELPFGIPKLMISTVASGHTEHYVQSYDITMMNSIADLDGLNRFTRRTLKNGASALIGMSESADEPSDSHDPTVAITMFGITTAGATTARTRLEEKGYEVVMFHANGTGGRAMERLVRENRIDGVLDFTTTELADEVVGGRMSAGPDRLEAAGAQAIPQVVSTGGLDTVNLGPPNEVPDEFQNRQLDPADSMTFLRTNQPENEQIGALLAKKVNQSSGPRAVVLPLDGVSQVDDEGEPFHGPEADKALFDSIKEHLDQQIEIDELDAHINDPEFGQYVADKMHELMSGEDENQ